MDAKRIAKDIDFCVGAWHADEGDSRSVVDVYADVIQKHIEMLRTPIDWPAVRREVAMRYMASLGANPEACGKHSEWAKESCDAAIALVAEFQRREEFGGGA